MLLDVPQEWFALALVAAPLLATLCFVRRIANRPDHAQAVNLFVYPIKSCAEVAVQSATATPRGFEGDRLFQCTDKHGKYCTPRDDDKARLFKVSPRYEGESLVLRAANMPELRLARDAIAARVQCEVLCAPKPLTLLDAGDEAAAWLEAATQIPGVRLTGLPRDSDRVVVVNQDQGDAVPTSGAAPVSLADEAPFLLTSVESLADLNARLKARGKAAVDMQRFRPNIVVGGLLPWEEDTIKRLAIDGVEFHAWQRCGRCKMTTIDRQTLKHGPEPLATLSTFRERDHGQRNFGMHLVPAEGWAGAGRVSVGGRLEVLEYHEERRAEWLRLFRGQ